MAEALATDILDHLNSGVIVVDEALVIRYWNRFLQIHSGRGQADIVGKPLFEAFPELPKAALSRKLQGVLQLGTPTFSSWEQRRHLFLLPHSRPITTDSEYMAQNVSFMPLHQDGGKKVTHVAIIIEDATDVCYFQQQLNTSMAQLEQSSRTDGLTQVANRRYWEERLRTEFCRCQRSGAAMSLILFDLDKFKLLNDGYGHQAGDYVLVTTAGLIKETLRTADLVGRYGGEEFGVLLPDTPIQAAALVAERLRALVDEHRFIYEGQLLPVTISLGVAELRADVPSHEKLVARADEALYFSKHAGRNRYTCAPVSEVPVAHA